MKVYVVAADYEYDGHTQPLGVYSTLEKARAEAELLCRKHGHDDFRAYEFALDAGNRYLQPIDPAA